MQHPPKPTLPAGTAGPKAAKNQQYSGDQVNSLVLIGLGGYNPSCIFPEIGGADLPRWERAPVVGIKEPLSFPRTFPSSHRMT